MSFFRALRERRRARIVRDRPIPDELWDWAINGHRIFRWLSEADRSRLRQLSTAFLGEKRFDPVGRAEPDDETRVSIAAQACLPLLGIEDGLDCYRDFTTIILTEREYDVRKRDVDAAGVVHEYDDEFAGEAFELGPVALSMADVEASGWGDGYNVVIHEMAHKLDALNGEFDGAPLLRPGMSPEAWQAAFSAAYEDLKARLASPAARKPRRGKLRKSGAPRIDAYAAEGPDEFFAVMCEYFYERPELLRQEYPAVYACLADYFGRDPAAGATEDR